MTGQELRETLDNYFLFKANDERFALWTASIAFHHPEQFFEMFAWNPHGLSGLDSKVAKYAASIPGLAQEYLSYLANRSDPAISAIYAQAAYALEHPGAFETFGQLMNHTEAYAIIKPYQKTTIDEIVGLLKEKPGSDGNPMPLDRLAARISGIRKRDWMRSVNTMDRRVDDPD